VEKGDPDRFAAAMAGPVSARRVLFPLYAFNLEVARAPWASQEPMIAEMRLQWWLDVLEDIVAGRAVRRHEVATPLAEVLDGAGAAILLPLVKARRWDIYRDPFEDPAHFSQYLEDTAGTLMWAAARALGASASAQSKVLRFGAAHGLVRYFQAIPALEEAGRQPLVDGRPGAVQGLAREALRHVRRAELRRLLGGRARAALTEGWDTSTLLRQVIRHPHRVAAGALGVARWRRPAALWLWS
jgi:phytoene synthase